MLAEYKGLAILFVVLCAAFAIYCLSTPRTARAPAAHHIVISPAASPAASSPVSTPAPAAAADVGQDVYVEALPSAAGTQSAPKNHAR